MVFLLPFSGDGHDSVTPPVKRHDSEHPPPDVKCIVKVFIESVLQYTLADSLSCDA